MVRSGQAHNGSPLIRCSPRSDASTSVTTAPPVQASVSMVKCKMLPTDERRASGPIAASRSHPPGESAGDQRSVPVRRPTDRRLGDWSPPRCAVAREPRSRQVSGARATTCVRPRSGTPRRRPQPGGRRGLLRTDGLPGAGVGAERGHHLPSGRVRRRRRGARRPFARHGSSPRATCRLRVAATAPGAGSSGDPAAAAARATSGTSHSRRRRGSKWVPPCHRRSVSRARVVVRRVVPGRRARAARTRGTGLQV